MLKHKTRSDNLYITLYKKTRARVSSSAPPNSPTATKSQPQRQPHPKDKRRSPACGEAKGSNQEPSQEAQPAERPGGRKGKDAKHPTGRQAEMLGSGTAKATPAAPHPTQTRKEGHRRGFRDFPLHTHTRRLSPHPAARKMDIAQRAKLAEQPTKSVMGDNAQVHPFAGLQLMDDVKQIVSAWVPIGAKHSHQAFSRNPG